MTPAAPTASYRSLVWGVAIVVLAALGLYVAVAVQVVRHSGLERLDLPWGLALNSHAVAHPAVAGLLMAVTELGSSWFLTVLMLSVAGFLAAHGQVRIAVVLVLAAAGGALVNTGLKSVYQRDRPEFRLVEEDSYSFASGHAMGSMVCYGLLAYLGQRSRHGWAARASVVAGLGLVIVAIGFSRLYLGAHWLTDVLAGYALGAAWLAPSLVALGWACRRGPAATTAAVGQTLPAIDPAPGARVR